MLMGTAAALARKAGLLFKREAMASLSHERNDSKHHQQQQKNSNSNRLGAAAAAAAAKTQRTMSITSTAKKK